MRPGTTGHRQAAEEEEEVTVGPTGNDTEETNPMEADITEIMVEVAGGTAATGHGITKTDEVAIEAPRLRNRKQKRTKS